MTKKEAIQNKEEIIKRLSEFKDYVDETVIPHYEKADAGMNLTNGELAEFMGDLAEIEKSEMDSFGLNSQGARNLGEYLSKLIEDVGKLK